MAHRFDIVAQQSKFAILVVLLKATSKFLSVLGLLTSCSDNADVLVARSVKTQWLAVEEAQLTGLNDLSAWQTQVNLGVGSQFDGAVVDLGFGYAAIAPAPLNPADFSPAVQVMRSMSSTKMSANFQRVFLSQLSVDWSDEAGFQQIATNVEQAAILTNQAQMRGMMLDIQMYGKSAFAVPEQSALGFEALEGVVRQRGAELAAAWLRGFPTSEVMVSWAYAEMFRDVCITGNDLRTHAYALFPAFIDGMRQSLARNGNRSQLIDGYLPSYPARPASHFATFKAAVHADEDQLRKVWQPNIVTHLDALGNLRGPIQWPASYTVTCDAATAARLRVPLKAAFGLMVDYEIDAFPRTLAPEVPRAAYGPGTFVPAMVAAARASDSYVWLYSGLRSWWIDSPTRPRVGTATWQQISTARSQLVNDPLGGAQ